MGFRLGNELPHEGFVQAALESHFGSCERQHVGHVDFACVDVAGRRWLIEAKGETRDIGLDFRTGLRQLLQGAPSPGWTLALAMPDTPGFARQRNRTPEWIRDALHLHWMLVQDDGSVTVEPPNSDQSDSQ
jgi:hypothetical protein